MKPPDESASACAWRGCDLFRQRLPTAPGMDNKHPCLLFCRSLRKSRLCIGKREMETVTIPHRLLADAVENVVRHYGLKDSSSKCEKYLTSLSSRHENGLTLDLPTDVIDIKSEYWRLLGPSNVDEWIFHEIALLRALHVGLCHPSEIVPAKPAIEDLLKMYILMKTNKDIGGWVGLKTMSGSVRLKNADNWFFQFFNQTFKDEGISSLAEAQKRLERMKRKKGRKPKDNRLRALLWGGFQMLTELRSFETDMPNALCEFILLFSQWIGLVPLDTNIDIQWIRSELRYIRSRPVKPEYTL